MNTTSIKIYGTKYTANIPTEIVKEVEVNFPNKEMAVCFDLECELSTLKKDESVCWGDGETFYIVLTDKQ